MPVRIHLCTEIPATPTVVWTAIADIASHVEWMVDAERITFVTKQRTGVGTEFDCLTVVGPLHTTDHLRVTEWEPEHVMGIDHFGAVTGSGRFTLGPSPRGTEFCWAEELTFPWWLGGAVGAGAAKPLLARLWRRNLGRLRA